MPTLIIFLFFLDMACNYPYVLIRKEPLLHVVPVPCGHCQACRRDKISMWSDRVAFEALTSPLQSSFLTLTYDDAHMPPDRSANLRHVQLFFKNLRYRTKEHFRYFLTSEYGDMHFRVHYHACLLNFPPSNENFLNVEKSWSDKLGICKGLFTLDGLNPARIRYCIEYMSYENPKLEAAYRAIGLGKAIHTMSKGIGKDWLFAHAADIRASDGYYRDGVLRPLPRYYKDQLGMIEKNAYLKDLDNIWKKYNDILELKGIDPVNPFDVHSLVKRRLLDQSSVDSKRTVLQNMICAEGKELAMAHKNLINISKKY